MTHGGRSLSSCGHAYYYIDAISKCAFLLGFHLEIKFAFLKRKIIKKSNNVGVERSMATRRTQMMWPMMTVTVTNFEGFTRQQFAKNVNFRQK